MRTGTRRVGVLLFHDVEVLDFAGPFEVFSVASRVALRDGDATVPPFDVVTVARDAAIAARHGLRVSPDYRFAECPPLDVFIAPGGVVDDPLRDPLTLGFVAARADAAECVASVCTGAFVLAAAGVLVDGPATTHWEDVGALRAAYPQLSVETGAPFVRGRRAISSAGVASGITMSLAIVEDFWGADLADRTAKQIEVGPLRGASQA